jgi:hypothetical protein
LVTDSARWDGFEFRPDDIVISTPPKCGTTWTQMICALLIFQTPAFDQPMSRISPWLDMLTRPRTEVFADLEAQTHRRFIKTHTPLDGLPWDENVTYIDVGRDPRDVALSMAHHMGNLNFDNFLSALAATAAADGGADPFAAAAPPAEGAADSPPPEFPAELSDRDRFFLWVDNPNPATEETSSLLSTLNHHETFWNERAAGNIVLLHYDDLKTDLEGQMRALATRLGIAVPEDRWPALVEAATFEQMRGNAERVAPNTDGAFWTSTEDFFHRGTSGQWRDLLDDDDLRRYEKRVAKLVAPDLAAWIHHRS